MDTIFTIDSEKKLLLYTCGSSIFLRTAVNTDLTRQIILCNDYACALSAVIYRGTVHYAYQNLKGDLIIRNILDTSVLYCLPAQESPDCFSPVLLNFSNRLVLVYFVKNPLNEQFLLKVSFPLDTTDFLCEEQMFSMLPVLQFQVTGTQLLLTCIENDRTYFFLFNESNQFVSFTPHSSLPVKSEIQKAEFLIKEWETKMLLEANTWKQKIEEKEKLISSVKKQYEELMDTATRYREEAIKWHNKYYAIRNK